MSYTARKSFTHAAILSLGLVLVGCQGGGGSDNSQEAASLAPDSALLSWDAPSQRENGETLKVGSIDHYVVSWGQDPENLSNTREVGCETCVDMEYLIEDLPEGTWHFTVQTRDTQGNLSGKADLASKQI
ncbi:fibronectin type III domain-containing protein [Salicola sp. Rm-C-2C1-2]|uniref:fibronectin type III domain-containing protein n=1 Tax=Salicola sp. Rm-C-2C1-2 TaxID=3141321 RepID=UPI0032E46903